MLGSFFFLIFAKFFKMARISFNGYGMGRLLFFALLPLLLTLSACGDEESLKPYSVDPELDIYLQRFLASAKEHGKNFDLESDGLVMEFADLPYPTVGLCHLTDPIKVQIDPAFWRGTTGKADQENQRENTVFHELGHGLLRRQHINATLPDTEWKSIMCGGEQKEGRAWFVNFSGARKQYYLDELFNPGAEAPAFMRMEYQPVACGDVLYDMELVRPVLLTNSTGSGSLNLLLDHDFNGGFYVEAEVEMEASVGLFVGSGGSYSYFDLDASGRVVLGNTACLEPFSEVFLPDTLSLAGRVKLGMLRRGDELSFFVNGLRFYWNDFPLGGHDGMGVCLPANGRLRLHSFVVYAL